MSVEFDRAALEEFFPQEELDPVLVPYLYDHERLGQTLSHPLVVQVAYSPLLAGMANRALRQKTKLAAEAREEGRWHSYVFIHERPYRSMALESIRRLMPAEAYWKLLASVWEDTENLHQWGRLIPRLLGDQRPGKDEHFMVPEEREVFDALPARFVIYRGFNHLSWWGWSWTLSEEKAEWFARRFASVLGPAQVASATVRKDKVFGYIGRRGEDEIIVNPNRLPNKVEVRELHG